MHYLSCSENLPPTRRGKGKAFDGRRERYIHMKKIMLFICFFALLIAPLSGFDSDAYASDNIRLFVNNEELVCDVEPVIINSRTMVPVRGIFEKLNAEVSWNDMLNQVIITSEDSIIIITVNSNVAYLNSKIVYLDSAPVIINGRTLVPVRFISESIGYDVDWDGTTRTVWISKPENDSGNKKDEQAATEVKKENNPENKEPSFSANITSIKVRQNKEKTEIAVNITKKIQPKISVLESPDRLVVDFNEVYQTCADEKIKNAPYPIKEIRWAKHDTYSRIVVESEKKIKYSYEYKSENEFVITVETSETSDSSASDNKTTDKNSTSEKDKAPETSKKPVANISGVPTVIVDAGHGGRDSGAVGRNEDGEVVLSEKDVCLDIAKKLSALLTAKGVNVVMTRSEDVALGDTTMEDLLARCEIANESDACLFVSIHNNGFTDPEASGTCVLYAGLSTNEDYGISGKELAQNILTPLVDVVNLRNRGLVESPNIVVLKRTAMPAALVECAFITCERDREILASETKRAEMAQAICDGIITSLKQMGRMK